MDINLHLTRLTSKFQSQFLAQVTVRVGFGLGVVMVRVRTSLKRIVGKPDLWLTQGVNDLLQIPVVKVFIYISVSDSFVYVPTATEHGWYCMSSGCTLIYLYSLQQLLFAFLQSHCGIERRWAKQILAQWRWGYIGIKCLYITVQQTPRCSTFTFIHSV